jgi:hypothetical protein
LVITLFPIGSIAEGGVTNLTSWVELPALSAMEAALQYDDVNNSLILLSGAFEIADTFEIPTSGSVIIENSASLCVSGQLFAAGTLVVQNGGTLTINGGTISITGMVGVTGSETKLVNNGAIFVNGGNLTVDASAAYSQIDDAPRITIDGGEVTGVDGAYIVDSGGLSPLFVEEGITSEAELLAALDAAGLDPNTNHSISITESFELTDTVTFPENTSVNITNVLTVPTGKTLTIRGVLLVTINGAVINAGTIRIYGKYQNNGVYILQGQGNVKLESGGSVTGTIANAVLRPKGDVNGDLYIRNDDVKSILSYRIGDIVLDPVQLSYGDMDGANGVDLMDALLLSKILPEGEWSHVYP